MDRENFYILLELGYDPPETDVARIRSALHARKQEWTRWQDNPGKRNTALTNLGLAPEIEKVMMNPVARQQEAEAAVALREERLREFEAELRILEGKGYILPREASAIAVKYKAFGVDKEKVAAAAKAPVSETPPEKKREEEAAEILDRVTAKTIQRNLALLGFSDLYAFLGEPQYSSVKKLSDAAEQKRRAAASGGKSSTATITGELSGLCIQLFQSFDTKQRYDRYLKVGAYPELCDLIDQEYTRSKYLSPEILLRLVNFAVEKYRIGVLQAEEAIRRYCSAYDIPVDKESRDLTCPACGNRTDRSGAACGICGAPLRGECPGCGTPFEGGIPVCAACGFQLSGMVKALTCIGEAENALIENNWSTAERSLAYAKKYWPGHPRIVPLEKRAILLEERYSHYIDNIADCVRHNQYYAALDLVNEASARRIQLPTATADHVRKVIFDLEEGIKALNDGPQPPPFEEVLRLAETVGDSMELSHLMRKHPPEAPEKLIASVTDRHVRLTWSVSAAMGLKEYVVVRKVGEAPLTAYDGDILYEGRANSFLDRTAQPLAEYFYSVYTRRGGAYSAEAATSGPLMVVREIENLRILPLDMGAQLSWDYNPDVRDIQIWRKLGGERPAEPEDGIELESPRLDGFTDSRIKNGVEYWYFIVAVYIVNGKRYTSRGVSERVMPHKPLAPIEQLMVVRTDNGEDEFVAHWQSPQYSDVLLFVSARKPEHKMGDMVSLGELLEKYRKIDLDLKQQQSARFHFSWNGGVYMFAAAVSGNFSTVGEIRYLANVQDVSSPTFDMVEDVMYLNMKWPAGLTEVAVAYRYDHYPKSVDEAGVTIVRCTKEQYDYNAGVMIRDPEPVTYYITIFSAFVTPENGYVYSPGVNMLVNNTAQKELFYRLKRTKRFFSSTSVISITVFSEEAFTMRKALVVGKVGRLPLSKNDGIPLFEIDRETKADGSIVYEYRTSTLPDNLYVRLFFQDESLYESIRLLPAGGLKIT